MSVTLETVRSRKLAAVRRVVATGGVGAAWGPAISLVWDFIRGQAGLWSGGHNVFVYYQTPDQPNAPILCDFGVEVTRVFDPYGQVYATETPSGEAAVCVHRGAYDRLDNAYVAIDQWIAANGRESAGCTWEIYGDPTPDPANTETVVVRLLK